MSAKPHEQRAARLLVMFPGASSRGGAEDYALTIAKSAKLRGWEVHAAFPDTCPVSLIEDFRANGCRFHALRFPENLRRLKLPREIFGQSFRVAALLARVRPDVALIALPWPDRCPGLLFGCALFNTPALVVFQLAPRVVDFSGKKLKAYEWARKRSQQWVAVSDQNRRVLSKMFRAPETEIARVYNGAPLETLRAETGDVTALRREAREEFHLPENARIALTVGRIEEQKGHRYLLPAIPHIAKNFPDVFFAWVGDGDQRETLEARAREYDIADRVLFLGRRADVPRLMKASDLFVFPTCYEGHPFALIEAMASGLPLVSTNASGIAELVTHRVHGLLCRTHDSCELRDAIEWALTHPDEMRAMAANAKLRALDFSQEKMLRETFALLEKIAARSPRFAAQNRASQKNESPLCAGLPPR